MTNWECNAKLGLDQIRNSGRQLGCNLIWDLYAVVLYLSLDRNGEIQLDCLLLSAGVRVTQTQLSYLLGPDQILYYSISIRVYHHNIALCVFFQRTTSARDGISE